MKNVPLICNFIQYEDGNIDNSSKKCTQATWLQLQPEYQKQKKEYK